MSVLVISKFEEVIVISLLVSKKKGLKIFNPSDLWQKLLNDIGLLTLQRLKSTAFEHHRKQ